MENHILLKDLADELGLDRSNARKYVLRLGISFLKVRTPDSKGQLTLALTPEDAETVKKTRLNEGFAIGKRPGKVIADNRGWFYIFQVVPELEPGRVKLGFTDNMDSRLRAYGTIAPTSKVLKTWPCKRSWEPAALASLTREGCTSLSAEVFVTDDLEALVERGEAFFALMPNLVTEE